MDEGRAETLAAPRRHSLAHDREHPKPQDARRSGTIRTDSLHRPCEIAARLSRDAEAAGNVMRVLVVNVSGEASKHGFTPDELLAQAGELLVCPALTWPG